MDLQTPHTSLVADEHVSTQTVLDIPDTKGRIPRSGDGGIRIRHLEASDGGGMSTESMLTDAGYLC